MHSIVSLPRCAVLILACLAAALPRAAAAANVITYHNDNNRTGWNPAETTLTPASVNYQTGPFGLLAQTALDEQVQAQPLFMGGETIAGGVHDVVYVVTENNTVYAIDAASGTVLLSRNLGTPVPQAVLPSQCNNGSTHVGINSTPVIDPALGTIFVVTYGLENSVQVYRVHALNLTTLADMTPPVIVSASSRLSDGRTFTFNAANQQQRPGLLETAGNIYVGFGSFCDGNTNLSRGWLLGFNAATLAPLAQARLIDARAHAPTDFFMSSIWMSGYGIASDDRGSVFFVTGNSDPAGTSYNDPENLSESVVKLSTDLASLEAVFTPSNKGALDSGDLDMGSGGVMLIPHAAHAPDMAVVAGKADPLFLLKRDGNGPRAHMKTLGEYANQGCWCGPSFFTGADGVGRVVGSTGAGISLWQVQTAPVGALVNGFSYDGMGTGQLPGFFTSVSSNGTTPGTAVIWALTRPQYGDPNTLVYLVAFDAAQGPAALYAAAAGTWPYLGGDANLVPTVANGRVYVASYANLSIFGLPSTGASRRFVAPPRPTGASAVFFEKKKQKTFTH